MFALLVSLYAVTLTFKSVCQVYSLTGASQLVLLSDCVCPGCELRLECTVIGQGLTVWTGTAFDCESAGNEIALFHRILSERVCNDGTTIIVGRGIRQEGLNFTSQLIIEEVNSTLERRTVKCLHDDFNEETIVGSYTIQFTCKYTTSVIKIIVITN